MSSDYTFIPRLYVRVAICSLYGSLYRFYHGLVLSLGV
nr:MAG TPA: hypothetical protein [Caudoviricetes sp.]